MIKRNSVLAAALAFAVPLAMSAPALAHHSFAMFDQKQVMTLKGTVHEFQWTNPHAWIELDVSQGGKMVRWSIELNSPNNLKRQGWSRNALKPGDMVTVRINPLARRQARRPVPRCRAAQWQGARFRPAQRWHADQCAQGLRRDEMKHAIRLTLAALLLAPASAALAHHSYAMFDMNKTVSLEGSIVRFKWQNPHAFIEIDVPVKGQVEHWTIEMTSPNNLQESGWRRTSLKPGDKVTLKIHPLRNGSKGGSYLAVKLADGSNSG